MTVFVDASVVMYLVGAEHPNRPRAEALLDSLVMAGTKLVTDAEVFQEILHRYAAIKRPAALVDAYTLMSELVDEVYAIRREDVDAAMALVLDGVGARDAIHVATMRAHGVSRIASFDQGFDRFGDLTRLP